MRIALYIGAAIGAWLLYEALTRPAAPVVSGSSATRLSAAEREYYRQSFDYTMEHIEAGKHYEWASHSGKGIITPGSSFVSKSKSTCREFSERFTVGGAEEMREGIACRREGREGWCRLRKDQALTCAMESYGVRAGAPNVNVGVPSINVPSGGSGNTSVSGPDVDAPDIDAPSGEQPTGSEIADTVTGTAGKAGTTASKGIADWFFGTFR